MDDKALQSTLRSALEHYRAGRVADAERLYRDVLAVSPDNALALHHLGIIALQHRQPEAAARLIGRSVQLAPSPAALNNLGEAFRALGRLPESIDCYKRAIAMDERHVNAMANLGLALTSLNQYPGAEATLRQAIALAPNHLPALAALAKMLTLCTRHDESVAIWERAARASPMNIDCQRSLASAWLEAGNPYRAIGVIRRTIELWPSDAQGHFILSQALNRINKTDEAIAAARRAAELAPLQWMAHRHLGDLLEKIGQTSAAVIAFEEAIRLNPREAGLFGTLATALSQEGRMEESAQAALKAIELDPRDIKVYKRLWGVRTTARDFAAAEEAIRNAVALEPHDVESHAHLAFSLLSLGKYEEGFREYEWRWRDAKSTTRPRDFEQPLWDGSDLSGRTILIHSEQGFGDVFQFLRYVPAVRRQAATVIVESNYKITGLVRRMAADVVVCTSGMMLPRFDLHVPMASLPAILGTTAKTIPTVVPYLRADQILAAQWRSKLEPLNRLLVGLVWAGNPRPDPKRSATLADMAPLGAVPGVSLISMQPRPEADEASKPPEGMILKNLGPELRDFAETTASLLANLDLLITVDTGVAHLAGAMGIPTWVLLRESPEWRWTLHEQVSAWYPTMRLFRQPSKGDWASVVRRVAEELRILSERRSERSNPREHPV